MSERRRTMVERVEEVPIPPQPQLAPARQAPSIESVDIVESPNTPSLGKSASGMGQSSTSGTAPLNTSNVPGSVSAPKKGQAARKDCHVYRPTNRPPMALLFVVDDGSSGRGECFRIRSDRTVIGREGCDIVVGHDAALSTRHAEIVRQFDRGRYRWFLRDLESTNGTFVRVFKTKLRHNQVWTIGSRRYKCRLVHQGPSTSSPSTADGQQDNQPPDFAVQRKATMGWKAISSEDLLQNNATLVTLLPSGGEGATFPFSADEMTLGSDSSRCSLVIQGDPYISKLHAVISRTNTDRWVIEDAKSTNGLWLRVADLPIEDSCQFQLGEQRFLFRVV